MNNLEAGVWIFMRSFGPQASQSDLTLLLLRQLEYLKID